MVQGVSHRPCLAHIWASPSLEVPAVLHRFSRFAPLLHSIAEYMYIDAARASVDLEGGDRGDAVGRFLVDTGGDDIVLTASLARRSVSRMSG